MDSGNSNSRAIRAVDVSGLELELEDTFAKSGSTCNAREEETVTVTRYIPPDFWPSGKVWL
jgi:hypothetical protein